MKFIKNTILPILLISISLNTWATDMTRWILNYWNSFFAAPNIYSVFNHLDDQQFETLQFLMQMEINSQTSEATLQTILSDSPEQWGGVNLPYLTPFHYEILEQAKGKHVLEIGSARGYFVAKLAVAGAKTITAIELMKKELAEMPEILKGYEHLLHIQVMEKVWKYAGDANEILKNTSLNPKPEMAVLLNVLHYQSPFDCIELLKTLHTATDDSAKIYGIANAFMTSQNLPKIIQYNRQMNVPYPGYVVTDLEERLKIVLPKLNKTLISGKDYPKAEYRTQWHSINTTQNFKLTQKFDGHYHSPETANVTKKHHHEQWGDIEETLKLTHQFFFLIDQPSLKKIFEASGWELTNSYYSTSGYIQYTEEELLNNVDLLNNDINIFFTAKKKSNPTFDEEL